MDLEGRSLRGESGGAESEGWIWRSRVRGGSRGAESEGWTWRGGVSVVNPL